MPRVYIARHLTIIYLLGNFVIIYFYFYLFLCLILIILFIFFIILHTAELLDDSLCIIIIKNYY